MRHLFCNPNWENCTLSFQEEIERAFIVGILFYFQTKDSLSFFFFFRKLAYLVDNKKLIALLNPKQEM